MNWTTQVALRYFFTRKKDKFANLTSKISIFAITFGIAMLIVSLAVIRGFEKTITHKILQDQGHLIIHGMHGPFEPEAVLQKIPKELQAMPMVETHGMIVRNQRVDTVLIRGVSAEYVQNLQPYYGNAVAKENGKVNVKIGYKLAKQLGLNVQDVVHLMVAMVAPAPIFMVPENIECAINQIVKFDLHDLNRYGVICDIQEAQRMLDMKNKVTKVICFGKTPEEALHYLPKLKAALPEYDIYTWQDLNMLFADIMRIQRNMVTVILFALVVLAIIANLASLVLLVHTKKREVNLLRIFGAKRLAIVSVFLKVGMIITLLSTLLGVLIGLLITHYLDAIRKFVEYAIGKKIFDPEVYLLPAIPRQVCWQDVIMVVIVSLVISFITLFWAVWRSTNKEIEAN